MRTSNLPAGNIRQAETGLTWEERLSGASGSIEVHQQATVRVRAAAGTTVTIDGILAATMIATEIMYFNAGDGDPSDSKPTVTITFSGAVFAQVARDVERKRLLD